MISTPYLNLVCEQKQLIYVSRFFFIGCWRELVMVWLVC